MNFVLVLAASYLIGSIPFSLLSSKLKGHDPRKAGTGNVGATNALVVAGPLAGLLALAGDIGKGSLAIYLARSYQLPPLGIALAGMAAVIGHDFSVFLKFKGGKGIATTGGALLGIDLIFGLLAMLMWFLCMAVVRYFIPGTILALGLIPIIMLIFSWPAEYVMFGLAAFFLAIYAHRFDLQKFFNGQELTIQESVAKFLKK